MSTASADSSIDRWVHETARSFSESGLHYPELDAALDGAADAIRQVLEIASAPDSFTRDTDDHTSQSG